MLSGSVTATRPSQRSWSVSRCQLVTWWVIARRTRKFVRFRSIPPTNTRWHCALSYVLCHVLAVFRVDGCFFFCACNFLRNIQRPARSTPPYHTFLEAVTLMLLGKLVNTWSLNCPVVCIWMFQIKFNFDWCKLTTQFVIVSLCVIVKLRMHFMRFQFIWCWATQSD